MILPDSTVWLAHLAGDARAQDLASLLKKNSVVVHPLVFGELAVAPLGEGRQVFLTDLGELVDGEMVGNREVLDFVERQRLHGVGIGYVGAQLLAAVHRSEDLLWSLDDRLQRIAEQMGVGFPQDHGE